MTAEVWTHENPIELECPLCGKVWFPSMFEDYCIPACGCYGTKPTRDTPCEPCGISHAWNCPNVPGHAERTARTTQPQLVELWPEGTEVHKGKIG